MKLTKQGERMWPLLLAGAITMLTLMGVPDLALAQDPYTTKPVPEGIYLELTKDFYDALREAGSGGGKVYTNSPSNDYLRQIAVSTRFMVETNLQILKQQERILFLLQTLADKQKK